MPEPVSFSIFRAGFTPSLAPFSLYVRSFFRFRRDNSRRRPTLKYFYGRFSNDVERHREFMNRKHDRNTVPDLRATQRAIKS